MRTILTLTICLALLGAAQADELRLSDVKDLVEQYVDHETSADTREELLTQLDDADKALLKKALNKHVKKDNDACQHALELALDLRVQGLWSSIEKHIDSNLEDIVIEYGLKLQDKGAVETLVSRWKKLDVEDASFAILHNAIQECVLPLESLEGFYKYLKSAKEDDPKKGHAFGLLIKQLGNDDIKTHDQLVKSWDDLFSKLKIYGRDFELEGDDLLALDGWSFTNAKRIRNNYLLESGGSALLTPLPEKMQSGNWTIRMRVYVISGDGISLGISSEQGSWSPELDGDEWLLKSGTAESFALPAQREKWTTFEFTITDRSTEAKRMSRSVKISIDGKLFNTGQGTLALNGELINIFGYANKGEIVVSQMSFANR